MALIFHVDINSYFATMLQQENPLLRHKPVGVVKDLGRTCIIASSNEAKKVGIKTGCSVFEAKARCKNIILVPTNFDIFLASTRKLQKLFTDLCPQVDIFSLDEAFLDMTGCELLMRQYLPSSPINNQFILWHHFAHAIQTQVRDVLGEWVQCNVGIASNKLLAKMASEITPKGSVLEITPHNLIEILSTTPFSDVCGIGYRLEEKLLHLGVKTPYQINLLGEDVLKEYVGSFWAAELLKIANGQETHFFTHTSKVDHMQSVGRSFTVFQLCDNEKDIKHTILNLLEEAALKMRTMKLVGYSLGISLKGKHNRWSAFLRLKSPIRHTNEMFSLLYHAHYSMWKRTFPILKFSVFIGNLIPYDQVPIPLLPQYLKQDIVCDTVDRINNRFGYFSIKPATLLGKSIIKREVTGFLGDKTYYGL